MPAATDDRFRGAGAMLAKNTSRPGSPTWWIQPAIAAAYSKPMSSDHPFPPPAAAGRDDPPWWWGNLAVALVLTVAAAGAGLLAGSIA